MNGKIRIRHIYKATELKRFHKLEGKCHHMGKTHSGGDTMRVVFEDESGKWLALMVWGSHCDADGVLPVSPEQAESLYEAMRGVRDWRDDNKSIPAASMLSIVVMAMMSEANSVKAVWRFGERLTMAQRRELCLRHDKDRFGKPLKAYFKVPSYVTFYKFLRKLDLVDFGEKLSAWLQSQEGTLPRRLALDGKFVKEVMGVVSMVDCETGAPVAVASSRRKEGTVRRSRRKYRRIQTWHSTSSWERRSKVNHHANLQGDILQYVAAATGAMGKAALNGSKHPST